tara:strand:+ start:2267 stop:2767 length:501 start_codon:yes stop_codon:yes gene_type:complete
MGVSVTDVHTASDGAQLPLGFIYREPADATNNYGERHWIYVYNDEASDNFVQGQIVMRDDGTTTYDAVLTPAGGLRSSRRVIGVAQHTIAFGSYGFVLRQGLGEVMAGAGAVIGTNTALTSGGTTTAGTALDFAAGTTAPDCVIAFSTEASTGTSGLATCMINCLG